MSAMNYAMPISRNNSATNGMTIRVSHILATFQEK